MVISTSPAGVGETLKPRQGSVPCRRSCCCREHGSCPHVPKHMLSLETAAQAQRRADGRLDGWMDGRTHRSEPSGSSSGVASCGSALLFPTGMG